MSLDIINFCIRRKSKMKHESLPVKHKSLSLAASKKKQFLVAPKKSQSCISRPSFKVVFTKS